LQRKTIKIAEIYIYVFPFKAMAIMVSYYFFIRMNVKEFKPKIHLMKL
jgi:hypothetical protein